MNISRRTGKTIILALAYVGLAHFLFGLFITFRSMIASDSPRVYLWFALPYTGILAIFIVSVFLAHTNRLRRAAATLILALLVSMGACIYDFQNHRYQATGGGIGAQYFIWWWYYEPFWYGYEPGNV